VTFDVMSLVNMKFVVCEGTTPCFLWVGRGSDEVTDESITMYGITCPGCINL